MGADRCSSAREALGPAKDLIACQSPMLSQVLTGMHERSNNCPLNLAYFFNTIHVMSCHPNSIPRRTAQSATQVIQL